MITVGPLRRNVLWLLVLVLAAGSLGLAVPLLLRTYVTAFLVLVNLILFVLTFLLFVFQPDFGGRVALSQFLRQELFFKPQDLLVPRPQTLLTSMFLHASVAHVIGNVFALYLLGMPLEDRIGGPTFAAVYLLSGLAASGLYAAIRWAGNTPALGASGAIMGIAGAFLALYPRDRIFFPLGFIIVPDLPVYLAVGVVLAGEAVLLVLGVQDGIAHAAHLGGVGAGILLGPLLHRPKKEPRGRRVVAADLHALATTEPQRTVLARIEGETVEEVRTAWVDRFLEDAKCPRCDGPLVRRGRRIVSDCGWERRL